MPAFALLRCEPRDRPSMHSCEGWHVRLFLMIQQFTGRPPGRIPIKPEPNINTVTSYSSHGGVALPA